MKLVLLPGLDGTGDMFAPLLSTLEGFDVEVVPLPQTGNQDYETLTRYVMDRLPEEKFVLVAESFSAPIGAMLAARSIPQIKGIVFVATFLSAPNKLLLSLSKIMPLKVLARLPFAKSAFRVLFLGKEADDNLAVLFQNTVRDLSSAVMKARLTSIQTLALELPEIELPAVYILPSSDRLVPKSQSLKFKIYFKRLLVKEVEGPHFLLQTKPIAAVHILSEFADSLET